MPEEPSLHDATLVSVELLWAQGRCNLELLVVGAGPSELTFVGVTGIHLPRRHPWGPSVYVNAFRTVEPGSFELELQSGDVLCIKAESWSFKQVAG